MKIQREVKRKGIIFYYIIAIVIPCFLLGILAFRGIKNDQALVEREQRRILQETRQSVFQDLDGYLSEIENRFIEIAAPDPLPTQQIFNDSALNHFCKMVNVVEGIFYLENKTNLCFYNNELLYFPDGYLTGNKSPLPFSTLKNGWQYEFNTKEYDKAFQFYTALLRKTRQNRARGELLNAMARVKKKQGKFDSALAIYDSIQNNYGRIMIQNKIPLGIVAFLEKSNCYLQLNDTVSALENSVQLLRMLAKRNWELEKSYYLDYLSKADKMILLCQDLQNHKKNTLPEQAKAIKDSLFINQQETEYLLTFLKNRESISEISTQNSKAANYRHKYRINGKPYFYLLLSTGDRIEQGLIFDVPAVLEKMLIPLLKEQASSLNFYWEIIGEDGEWLAGSENIPEDIFPITSVFPSGLPSWSLAFYPGNMGLFTTFFRSGGGLFFYIFIVVLVILVFGLIFTLQTVNNKFQLSKMKSTFVSTVSHELKSPLTSIRQMAEMLVQKRVPSAARKEKYYMNILQQSERLSHLIENILDFSKMEAGQKKFQFEKTDLVAITEKVTESFKDRLTVRDYQINLSISNPTAEMWGDKESLEQVLYNLIDNAFKYSGNSKKMEIKIESAREMIALSVKDYGIGIRKEEHEKIFHQFYRVGEELTQTVKGTGIGLTIVKQIVEAHKGEITIESSPGKGSNFSIKFPVTANEVNKIK